MRVPIEKIKELRELTGAGVGECRKALLEGEGNLEKALQLLREKGAQIREKKKGRAAREGLIESYVHQGGRIGVLLELNCETDFVARTPEFKELAHHLAMQVAALSPEYISPEDAPEGQGSDEACLLLQPFIRDPQRKVQDVILEAVAKLRENIKVSRFVRFELGKP